MTTLNKTERALTSVVSVGDMLERKLVDVQSVANENIKEGVHKLRQVVDRLEEMAARVNEQVENCTEVIDTFAIYWETRCLEATMRVQRGLEELRLAALQQQPILFGVAEVLMQSHAKDPRAEVHGNLGGAIDVLLGLFVNATKVADLEHQMKGDFQQKWEATIKNPIQRLKDTINSLVEALSRNVHQLEGMVAIAEEHNVGWDEVGDRFGQTLQHTSGALAKIDPIARPVRNGVVTMNRLVKDTKHDLDRPLDATQNFFVWAPSEYCDVFFQVEHSWMWIIFAFSFVLILVAAGVAALGIYLVRRWTAAEETDDSNDERFVVGLCAFHPRVRELDYTLKEVACHPVERSRIRIRHVLIHHRWLALVYGALWVLAHLAAAAMFLAFCACSLLGALIAQAGSGFCDLPSARIFSEVGTCLYFVHDAAACTRDVMLVCPGATSYMGGSLVTAGVAYLIACPIALSQWYALAETLHQSFLDVFDTLMVERTS
mmetsp:Transcript_8277/g.20864  ORF Transcript_8277/g.20864 Transcript_8277/m.20864 type:complete len:489 (-) Transcript_8277:124-1590(-)